tara:strand:- start:1689 stop:2666 length:978 start_codon:yes stop_codon:yes gene_type:complete
MKKQIKIIGAGIFGCAIAYELNRAGHNVIIIEQDSDIMQRASKCNHNRLHLGYHYPRSIETAEQSLEGLITFLTNYKKAIVSHFPNYYMVAKNNSYITANEYIKFCNDIKIDYTYKMPDKLLINQELIDLSISTDEAIFDYDILKSLVKKFVKDIDIKFNTKFDGNIDDCDYLINTTYASINKINKILGVPELKIKLQDVVIPYFKMDSKPFGITIMDGPFCSVMPKGNNPNEFLLYSVKHSLMKGGILDVDNIYTQSEKYLPFLKNVERLGYWRTERALPINDNDERLSEIFTYKEHPKVINVLSGKVSTCHKLGQEIKKMICK